MFCFQAVVIVERNSWDDAYVSVCCIFKAHLSRSLVSSTDGSEVSFLVDISRHRAYLPRKKWTSFRPSPFFTDSKWIRHDRTPTAWAPRHDRLCISTTFGSEQLHYEERGHICLIYYPYLESRSQSFLVVKYGRLATLIEGAMLTNQEHGQFKRAGPRNSTTFLRKVPDECETRC